MSFLLLLELTASKRRQRLTRHIDAAMSERQNTVDSRPIRRHFSLLRHGSPDESGPDAASRFSDVAVAVDRPISRVHLPADSAAAAAVAGRRCSAACLSSAVKTPVSRPTPTVRAHR